VADRPLSEARTVLRRGAWFWREFVVPLFIALLLAFFLKAFLVQPFFIPSGSMERTLHGCPGCSGDRVLVNKVVYDIRDIRRGEVVVFSGEGSWGNNEELPASAPVGWFSRSMTAVGRAVGAVPPASTDYVKRVIGLPGDRVACCTSDGRVTVQPAGSAEPVGLDEPYVFQDDHLPFCAAGLGAELCPTGAEGVLVPEGRVWVMGDHRSGSADSRAHLSGPASGTVPQDEVAGRAFLIVWPPSRAGRLSVPDTFADVED
jgi:signal peptidase I